MIYYLSIKKSILLVPFPPHYQSRQIENFYNQISKYIAPRNLSRLIVFKQPLGYAGVTWLVQNCIFVLGTLLHSCISSMPICIKYNKTFIGGIHNTIRIYAYSLSQAPIRTRFFITDSRHEYKYS